MTSAVCRTALTTAALVAFHLSAEEGSADSAAAAPDSAAVAAGVVAEGYGSLTVRSEPAGAEVTVDGVRVGPAPVTVDSLSPGTHRLQLSLEGYLTKAASVRTGTGAEQVTFTLVQPGALTVVADVPGAGVWLDSASLGPAPVTRDGLKPGQYTVRASKTGHADFSAQITIAAAGRDTVRAVLPALQTPPAAAEPPPVAAAVRPARRGSSRSATIAATIVFAVFAGVVIAIDAASD